MENVEASVFVQYVLLEAIPSWIFGADFRRRMERAITGIRCMRIAEGSSELSR